MFPNNTMYLRQLTTITDFYHKNNYFLITTIIQRNATTSKTHLIDGYKLVKLSYNHNYFLITVAMVPIIKTLI